MYQGTIICGAMIRINENHPFSLIQQRKNMVEWWYIWRRINCSHLSNRERTWWNGGTHGGGSAVLIYPSEDKHVGMLVHTSRRISCSHLSIRERTWKNPSKHGGGSAVLTYPTEKEHCGMLVVHMEEDQLYSLIQQRKNLDERWYTRRRIIISHWSIRGVQSRNGGTFGVRISLLTYIH